MRVSRCSALRSRSFSSPSIPPVAVNCFAGAPPRRVQIEKTSPNVSYYKKNSFSSKLKPCSIILIQFARRPPATASYT